MGGPIGIAIEIVPIALNALNVVAYTLQNIPRIEFQYSGPLVIFEFVFIAVFACEYFTRL